MGRLPGAEEGWDDAFALTVAIEFGLPHGGWCPRGRRTEDGPLHPRYRLLETEGDGYRQRTRRNVADSDATLMLNEGPVTVGRALTIQFAVWLPKPNLVLPLDQVTDWTGLVRHQFAAWLGEQRVGLLNVAGPGERKRPGIHGRACEALRRLPELVAGGEGSAPEFLAAQAAGELRYEATVSMVNQSARLERPLWD